MVDYEEFECPECGTQETPRPPEANNRLRAGLVQVENYKDINFYVECSECGETLAIWARIFDIREV